MSKKVSYSEKYWRWLANLWMTVTILVIVMDFLSAGKYTFLITPLSVLYITLLSVYITSKEFERWFKSYQGHHPGELALVFWTLLILGLVCANAYLGSGYHISSDVISTYLVVIGLFIASKSSKSLYHRRK